MSHEEHIELITSAVASLKKSVERLLEQTYPATPLPRFRKFEILPGVEWPYKSKSEEKYFPRRLSIDDDGYTLQLQEKRLAELIHGKTLGQPKLVLKAIRRLEAAAAWCEARAEGRKRMAEEIMRQQQKKQSVLDAEIAIRRL